MSETDTTYSAGPLPFAGSEFQAARRVVRTLRAAGFEACFAGGCVRDALLGRTPSDFDVATRARPEDVIRLFERTAAVGAKFGVVLVIQDGVPIETATYRRDASYSDGRHPDAVSFSDAREDALRRDFTVNALFLDPEQNQVIDYVGGRADLSARIVRAVGDPERRIGEDKLRMLRAVRFAAQLDFHIEDATGAAIVAHAAEITDVSAERIRDELTRMFTGPRPGPALRLLHQTGLLAAVLPEVAALHELPQPPAFHPEGDALTHTALVFDRLRETGEPSEALAFGALFHDVGKARTLHIDPDGRPRFPEHERVGAAMVETIGRRLKLSNETRERAAVLVREHMKFKDVPNMRRGTLRLFVSQPYFDEHLALHRADCRASHGDLTSETICRKTLAEAPPADRVPPLLRGGDLLAEGLSPGPAMGEILRAVFEAQLAGEIATRDQALAWAKQCFQEHFPDRRSGGG